MEKKQKTLNRKLCRLRGMFSRDFAPSQASRDSGRDLPRQEKLRPRMRILGMQWFLPLRSDTCLSGQEFLALVRHVCPAALPRRFGDCEPFAYELRQQESLFCQAWPGREKDIAWRSGLFWSTKSPCLSGSMFLAGSEARRGRAQGDPCLRISTTWDLRDNERNARQIERMVEGFAALAEELGAFYAAGFVQRDVVAGRCPGFDNQTEQSPLPRGLLWTGLPHEPTWLSWFGRPYRDLVAHCLPSWAIRERGQGLLVRLGEWPQDRDALAKLALAWPDTLVARPPVAPLTQPRNVVLNDGRVLHVPALPGPMRAARHIPDLNPK